MVNISNKLIKTSNKSIIAHHKHAAVVMFRGKPVSWGFNTISGKNSIHAEVDAVRRFLISQGFLGWVKRQRGLRGVWGKYEEKQVKCSFEYSKIIKENFCGCSEGKVQQ